MSASATLVAASARPRARRYTAGLLLLTLVLSLIGLTQPVAADTDGPVTIDVSASLSTVPSGQQLTYTINVVNTGGARADEMVLTDQVDGLTGLILTSTVGGCTQTANQVTCDAGSLEGFQAWQVTIRGIVTAANGTTLHNTATVMGTKSATTFTHADTVSTLVGNAGGAKPDLTLSIAAPTSAAPFSPVTYDLTVNNIGGINATDVTVVNTLPGGFDFVSVTPTSLFTCTQSAGTITCTGGRVNAGSNATITIKATSGNATAAYNDDTAVVDPFDSIDELNELNNTGSARTDVVAPTPPTGTLTITKDDGPDPLRPGDLLTYTIKAKNTATTRADSVAVTDGTQGLDAASITATTTHGACTVTASQVVCTQQSPVLRLQPNEVMTVTITGRVVASAGSIIRNTATVTGNIKNKGVSATAATTTSVRPGKDLTITQRAETTHEHNGNVFRAYDNFNYVITVGNSGLDDATGVVVREPLPAGVTFNSFTLGNPASGFNCVESFGVVTCSGGTIRGVLSSGQAGGTVEVITLNVTAPNAIGPITATATVDPSNSIFEADETNNVVSTTTMIETGIDLTAMKTANFNPVAPSGTLIYTITVSNIGTQDTTGVVVRDTLPAGVRFREAVGDPDHNFTCAHNGAAFGGTVECVGGILRGTHNHTLPVDQATITITLFAPAQPGLIKNQVRVDPTNAIPEIDETNNINTLITDVQIPAVPGGSGTYHDFTISKSHLPEPVAPSGTLEYTVTVTNHGSDVAFDVAVRDFLPAGSIFRSAIDTLPGPGAFSCTESGGVVNCVGGTLDGSSNQTQLVGDTTRTIKINVFAPEQPGAYDNQVVVDPNNALPEANETNNSASDITHVALPPAGGGVFVDFEITKAQSSPVGPVVPSGILEWDVTVSNSGSDAAFGVTVRDVLPAGTTFRSAQDITVPTTGAFTCNQAGGVVNCVGGTLDGSKNQTPGPITRTIRISVFAPTQPGTITNQATIDPDDAIAEGNETNNTATANSTVALGGGGSYIDLTMSKTGDTAVTPGSQITYTLTVGNTGTGDAFNVKVRDLLPAGTTFVSAADGAASGDGRFVCSQSGGTVDCIGGYLPPGGSRTIVVKVTAPNQHGLTLVNQAIADPNNEIPEASEINNTASAETAVQSAINLTVTKTGPTNATQSSTPTYTITVKNVATGSGERAEGVVVRDPLPVGMIVLNVTADQNFACQVEENPINVVTCLGDLNPGDSVTVNVQVFVTAESGASLDNEAKVDPDNLIAENNENDNSSTVNTVIGEPDLDIDKDDLFGTVTPGQSQTYTLTVQNIGTADATGVNVTDALPSEVTYVSAIATNGFTCSESSGTVTCTGDLPINAVTTITIQVTVSTSATTPITNTATVDPASGETLTGNNTASVTTSVGGSGFDFVVSDITDTPDPAPIGSTVTYTYAVTNTGTANATGVVITNSVPTPTGVSFVNASGSDGFNCVNTVGSPTSTSECTGNLPAGASTTITIKVGIGAGAPNNLQLTATVDQGGAFAETDETNNQQVETTTVDPNSCVNCADLNVVEVNDTPDPVAPGAALTYTVTVTNAGDMETAANGVVITDALDANVTFQTVTASGGFVCAHDGAATGGNVTCTGDLSAAEGVVITITVTVGGGVADGTVLNNTATAALVVGPPGPPDFNGANNSRNTTTTVDAP